MYNLFWAAADHSEELFGGEFECVDVAVAAIPSVREAFLAECRTDDQRTEILAGR